MRILRFSYLYYRRNPVASGEWFDSIPHFFVQKMHRLLSCLKYQGKVLQEERKGNLQMFATPVDFNWYSSVTSYYGYRIHPISGANQLHNGMDIGAPEGTKVMAGLTGTVTTSAYNDSYGNYVVIKDSKGYELRYAHLSSRSVSAGASVTKGDEIGLVGNTGNSTGSHLHIELLKNGERLNPIFYLETGEGAGFGGNEYTSEAAQRLLNEAARYLGTPYVWGGYSPSGFDCSGFVSYCLTNILVMISKACSVEDDMVMDMIFVNMGTDHIFIFSFQYFVCKLLT